MNNINKKIVFSVDHENTLLVMDVLISKEECILTYGVLYVQEMPVET